VIGVRNETMRRSTNWNIDIDQVKSHRQIENRFGPPAFP